MDLEVQRDYVTKYYGKTLNSSSDLRTSACCPIDAIPSAHKGIIAKLHEEVTSKFYGCGSPIPDYLEGVTVLDLGCGTGRDVYLASALVGPKGTVIGVDMTDSQLETARAYCEYHAEAFFGESTKSNVAFRKGYIEDLSSAYIDSDSVDVIISNCVCNLSPQKEKVFSEVFRVLKPGGELYFSDVYADRRLTPEAANNPILIGECLGGALYVEDFRRIMAKVGFFDIRVVSAAPVILNDRELLPLVSDVTFYSLTIRAFKLPQLDDCRENYAQTAIFTPDKDSKASDFILDVDNVFKAGVSRPIDFNTAAMLSATRFKDMFAISEAGTHQGLYYRLKDAPYFDQILDCFRPPLHLPSLSSFKSGGRKERKGSETTSCCPPSTKKAFKFSKSDDNGSCQVSSDSSTSPVPATAGNSCCKPSTQNVCNPSKLVESGRILFPENGNNSADEKSIRKQ